MLPAGALVRGVVWLDGDANGVRAAGEVGRSGVSVQLLQGTAAVATATTDVAGRYVFADVIPGAYTVQVARPLGMQFSPQRQGADATVDSDVDPTTGQSAPFSVTSGQVYAGPDAGLFQGVLPLLFLVGR